MAEPNERNSDSWRYVRGRTPIEEFLDDVPNWVYVTGALIGACIGAYWGFEDAGLGGAVRWSILGLFLGVLATSIIIMGLIWLIILSLIALAVLVIKLLFTGSF